MVVKEREGEGRKKEKNGMKRRGESGGERGVEVRG